jgi:type II secretory pathway pseudopilin PulG
MRFHSQNGMSLIETMISIGVLSITILAFATMTTNQNRSNQALTQKLATLDLANVVIRTIGDPVSCGTMVTNTPVTFNSDSVDKDTTIKLNSLYASDPSKGKVAPAAAISQAASPMSNGAVVSSIEIRDLNKVSETNYSGRLRISFDPNTLVYPLRPVELGISVITTAAPGVKTITGCQAGGGGGFDPASDTKVFKVGDKDCNNNICWNSNRAVETAERVCIEKGYTGLLSFNGVTHTGCNSCIYVEWENSSGGRWSKGINKCNSCGPIQGVTCYK